MYGNTMVRVILNFVIELEIRFDCINKKYAHIISIFQCLKP